MPLFDEDLERAARVARGGGPAEKADGRERWLPHCIAGVQQFDHGGLEEQHRLGIPPGSQRAAVGCLQGQDAILMSASPGALGGLRALVHVRSILGNIGMIVLPDQVAVPKAFEAYNDEGTLKDPKQHGAVEGLGRTLTTFLQKHIA